MIDEEGLTPKEYNIKIVEILINSAILKIQCGQVQHSLEILEEIKKRFELLKEMGEE